MREQPGHCTSISYLRPAFYWNQTRRSWQEPFQHYRRNDFSLALKHHIKPPRKGTPVAAEVPKLLSCHPATLNYHTHAELSRIVAEVPVEVPGAQAPAVSAAGGHVDNVGVKSYQAVRLESIARSAQEEAAERAVSSHMVQSSGQRTRRQGSTPARPAEAPTSHELEAAGVVENVIEEGTLAHDKLTQRLPSERTTQTGAGGLREQQGDRYGDQISPVQAMRPAVERAMRREDGIAEGPSSLVRVGASAASLADARCAEWRGSSGSRANAKRHRAALESPCSAYIAKTGPYWEPAVLPPQQDGLAEGRQRPAGSGDAARNQQSAGSSDAAHLDAVLREAMRLPDLDLARIAAMLDNAEAKVRSAAKEMEVHIAGVRRSMGLPDTPRLPRGTCQGGGTERALEAWAETVTARDQLLDRLLASIRTAQEQLAAGSR